MIKDFNDYIIKIEKEIEYIPNSNLMFWGMWFCEDLYSISNSTITDYFRKNEVILLHDIKNYLWNNIDSEVFGSIEQTDRYLYELQKLNETDLDETNYKEKALYELIISLDSILSHSISGEYDFGFNVSQTTINVLDSSLQEKGLDILSFEGFQLDSIQQEINSQFKMIEYLKKNIPTKSNCKTKFRKSIIYEKKHI